MLNSTNFGLLLSTILDTYAKMRNQDSAGQQEVWSNIEAKKKNSYVNSAAKAQFHNCIYL